MKVSEFPAFAAAVQKLDAMLAKRAELIAERDELLAKHKTPAPTPTTFDRVDALLRGDDPSPTAKVDSVAKRLGEIQLGLDTINRAESQARTMIERAREKARDEELDKRAADLDRIGRDFKVALRALTAACLAEDALRAELVAGGFGFSEETATALVFHSRAQLMAIAS